jgi:hypothetical protein
MTKDDTRQSSLKEAKQRGRQKMTNKGNCELESLKDIYSNVSMQIDSVYQH